MNPRRFPAILLLLAACDAPSGERSCKPQAPITLSAELSGDPLASCEIRAEAVCDAAEVEVEVVLPAGLAHLEGARTGTGRRVNLSVRARAADRRPRVVYVRATLREGSAKLTRVVSLPLEEAPRTPPGVLRKNARGETILELTP